MASIYDGSVKLQEVDGEGDIVYSGGQPQMDAGIESAAYISLFTESGWWGGEIGGGLEKIMRTATLSDETRIEIEQAAREALAWMLTDGVAASITVDTEEVSTYTIGLSVTIDEPSGSVSALRYLLNWQAMSVTDWAKNTGDK